MFAPPKPCMRRFVQCENNVPVMLDDEESLLHTLPNIDLTFDSEVDPTTGTLFVTSRRFIWLSEENAYDFDVQYIALHAISNDPESYKKPCLYCQFDQEEGEEDEDEPTEVYFIPEERDDVQKLFDIFSEAALNNPDDIDDEEGNDEENGSGMFPGGFIYNVDEVESGSQQARLNEWESVFRMPGENTEEHIGISNGVAGSNNANTTSSTKEEDSSDKDNDVL